MKQKIPCCRTSFIGGGATRAEHGDFLNQQGKVQLNHNWFLRYTKDADGNLVIDPEQAEIVRRIYGKYLEGASFLQIKRSLEADEIRNGAGHLKWHESNI